jgi:very-short-patch-repair endonuclease
MDSRFAEVAARAASHHSVVSLDELEALGVGRSLRHQWSAQGWLVRLGPRSFTLAGCPSTWTQACAGGLADLGGHGVLAGRGGCRLLGLDGFEGAKPEFLVPRGHRGMSTPWPLASSGRPLTRADSVTVDGLRVLRAERLILTAPLFGFDRQEIENAVDSAIRRRLVSEQRLRTRVLAEHTRGVNGSRVLLDAMVDSGGESRLERMFLAIVRRAGLARPTTQRVVRDGSRTLARVDFEFPGGLVVEVAGHGTHATRRQRQVDAQRLTELTLRGFRVLTFTYEDVRDRPDWVLARLTQGLTFTA